MVTTGLIFFGWRALLGTATLTFTTLATYTSISAIRRLVGLTKRIDSNLYALTSGLMLAAVLPPICNPTVAVIIGLGMGITLHAVGRACYLRTHPVALMIAMIWLVGTSLNGGRPVEWSDLFSAPGSVLRPQRIIVGNVCDAMGEMNDLPWWSISGTGMGDTIDRIEPYKLIVNEQQRLLKNSTVLPTLLSTGRLRPMGEIIIGAVPGSYGTTSIAIVLFLGLCVIYYRLTWWPMSAWTLAVAAATLLIMPITHLDQTVLVGWRLLDLRITVAITYVGYLLLASPLAFVAMVLAPQTMPASRQGRIIYGSIIGGGMILIQWIWALEIAAFFSLLIASSFSRPMDSLHPCPFTAKPTPTGDPHHHDTK